MKIELLEVLPEPIPQKALNASEVWGSALVFDSGKRHLISGVSGRGKSTLLHVIYGIRKDFKGQLLIDGKDSSAFSEEDWVHLRSRQVALLFQDLRLFPNLTARDNLNLLPRINPSAPSVEEMTERLGMTPFWDQSLATLSQGQRQRMALVRALRKPFQLLMLDEPFSHLDEGNQLNACSLIEEVVRGNHAGLLVSSLGSTPPITFDQRIEL